MKRHLNSFNWFVLVLIASGGACLLPLNISVAQEANGKREIVLGMSTALTGPAANLGENMRAGVLASLARANRDGGIQGRKLVLRSLDDGYEPTQTAPNMRQLLEQEHVLAVIGNVGTPTAIAAIPIANEQKTLFFAPFTGAGVLRRTPPDRYVINYRASYAEETSAMIDALIDQAGLKIQDIAFFTQRDGYGDAGFVGGIAGLKRHGLTHEHSVVHVRYARNTLAVENALADLLLKEPLPRAIVMVGAYAPCAKFIVLAKEAGFDGLFLNVSFVGSASLARELGKDFDEQVLITQVVPHPTEVHLPLVKDFHKDLQIVDPSAATTFGAFEGYIAARILLKALATINGQPTRENIIDALESLGKFEMGLGAPMVLTRAEHQASHRVWPTLLQDGSFVPFEWAEIPKLFQDKS